MKRRYKLTRDYHATVGAGGAGWGIYDTHCPRYDTSDETPIAVFATRGDAIAFRAWKEAQ